MKSVELPVFVEKLMKLVAVELLVVEVIAVY
jgi:hypothetical protein